MICFAKCGQRKHPQTHTKDVLHGTALSALDVLGVTVSFNRKIDDCRSVTKRRRCPKTNGLFQNIMQGNRQLLLYQAQFLLKQLIAE